MGRRKAVGKELDNAQTLMYSSVVISELWVWGRRGNILIFYTLFSLKRTFYSYFSIFIKKSSCGEKKYVWELPWDNHKMVITLLSTLENIIALLYCWRNCSSVWTTMLSEVPNQICYIIISRIYTTMVRQNWTCVRKS